MDKIGILKLIITVVIAAGSVLGTQYVATDAVSFTAAINAAVVAAVAYLKQSPVKPKE
jgi:hypothetical protein